MRRPFPLPIIKRLRLLELPPDRYRGNFSVIPILRPLQFFDLRPAEPAVVEFTLVMVEVLSLAVSLLRVGNQTTSNDPPGSTMSTQQWTTARRVVVVVGWTRRFQQFESIHQM